ncbi:trifunctional MMPL family transporter/lysophospholipid acyltransferase/class I SAM-dependent methyltransferase [Flavihumibacter petaseus]|uniref:Putative acyltransferase n=1 Tax=Flavihumibacter petaseus NBRC 106054 TaxID=1220578 RepID=A0A0E9MWI1_9BACT|nr:trifunctional MMPL family transporter/lysophospholipid acyltransferase/class I SAM-dependent methyltransferase [Flavihumibacter petaseus]GAO42102.1 putative acyltransferase [Flavihumibacter petaseus NBRC 106054]
MGANIFLVIYRYFRNHPWVFRLCFAAALALPAIFASRIKLEEDITAIIPQDEKTKQIDALFRQSKVLDKMILTVAWRDSIPQPDSLVQVTDSIAAVLQGRLAPLVKDVYWQVDEATSRLLLEKIHEQLPLYLEEKDYTAIDSLISAEGLRAQLNRNLRLLSSPAGLALKPFIAADLAGIGNPALKRLQLLQFDQQFTLYDAHILTSDQKEAVLFIDPAYSKNNTAKNALLLQALDSLKDDLQRSHPQISIRYFGGTAVAVGNALQLRRDSLLSQGLTVLFLIVFLAWYFRRVMAPVLVLVPAVMGGLLALAVIALFNGSISVIALGMGSIVLGIAVNYSLHVFNHCRHEHDMEQVLRDLTWPLTIGGVTTIGGFLCLLWVESPLLQDLGRFAAISLAGAAASSLIFLPPLLQPGSRKKSTAVDKAHTPEAHTYSWLDRFSNIRFETNKWLVFTILVLTVFFGCFISRVTFEPDLNRMNYMSDSLRSAQDHVNQLNAFALQSVYVVAEGKDLEDALRHQDQLTGKLQQLENSAIIKKYSGLQPLLISDSLQQVRIDRWNRYWTPEKKTWLLNNLKKEGTAIGFSEKAFQPTAALLQKNYHPVGDSMAAGLNRELTDNYLIRDSGSVKLITLVKTGNEQKTAVYEALHQQPGVTAIDMQYVTARLVDMVRKDFNRISWMAAAIVFGVLLLSFGRIELTLIAFLPMLISWIWILGIMGLTGMSFNIVNIIISALIFGLGDDYSLFTLEGLLQEYKTGRKNLGSFRSSILLSAITTLAGLGVLLFARHPSLRSIAGIAITGIGSVVLISQVMIPFLFRFLITGRTAKNRFPWTAWYLFTCIVAFTYFVVGALVLSIIGFLLLKANPFAGDRCKNVYHWFLAKFAWTQLHVMGNVKKQLINTTGEDFSRPAVIVSNHQSFLDILALMLLHPKIILFTNEWVWNSPVFGYVVKLADYFPVKKGVEDNITNLRKLVEKGYSIAVFPEGTRSPDGQMKRFHKGAFYLADQLGIDILPVLLRGTGYTMSKSDFMLKDGTIRTEILPRIRQDDTRFGNDYSERTKAIGKYFRDLYATPVAGVYDVDGYREKLIANYRYKGPVLEWYLRIKSRLEDNYRIFDKLMPRDGHILDAGCGYGFLSCMLQYTSPGRTITGLDYDEEKIAVADHGFTKTGKLHFQKADLTAWNWGKYNGILILDVLHYLAPADQEKVVGNALDSLLPGGVLIIREGNADLVKRQEGTKLTELFSTRILGFNKTGGDGLHFLSGSSIHAWASAKGFVVEEIDNTRHTANIIYVLKKSNETVGQAI